MATRKSTTTTKKQTEAVIGTVHGGTLNIRKQPDITSPCVGQLASGTQIDIIGDLGDWLKIDQGYVMKQWVTL